MTSIETGPTWSERLDPRNWTLAWKLAVVGLVPALLALSLGVLRVADQAGVAAELGRSSRLLEVREQVAGAADALRRERDEATLYVAGNRIGDRGVLEIGFRQTDADFAAMLTAIRSATELETTAAAVLSQPDAGASQLAALRKDVLDPPTPSVSVLDRYTQSIESLDVLDRALLRQLRTPGTASLTDALTAIRVTTGQLAYQHTLLGSAIRATQLQPSDSSAVTSADAQISAQFRQYQLALTPEQLVRFGNFVDDPANVERQRLETAILATPAGRPIALAPSEWDAAYAGALAAAERSGESIRQDLVASSTAAEEEASNLAGINSVILMLGLLLGITVALLVARSLIRSLRILRTAALDVAERRLPRAVESMRAGQTPDVNVDPVPLTSRDEVGQVARAFDAVHGQAIRLAADQAQLQSNVSAMFVNLSRRSQALVERQLQLIEQLESNEQDADQLSNLFQLDHLATRMRRNSENLLVLAGTDLAKRNTAPVPMVDVLRAAVSEVEQYQRVVVQSPPSCTIVGRAASDVVHLLAELLDNATNFSPPDSQVVMSTTRTADGSVLVEIADRGVGMIDHELSDANQRLGGPSTVDVSASRRMGLFVVGRLGARHGIGVQLSTTGAVASGGGLTASVTVPAYLVPSAQPVEAGRPVGAPSAAAGPAQASSAQASSAQASSAQASSAQASSAQASSAQASSAQASSAQASSDQASSAQAASMFGVPPQRAGVNGNGRAGSLSALVAGADGPANPTGVFDTPTGAGSDGPLFAPAPPTNGSPPGLPTRRPGSSMRPDRPSPGERPDPADKAETDQVAADRAASRTAREVADQARLDQESAGLAATDHAVQDRESDPGHRNGTTNGTHPNGDRPGPKTDGPATTSANGPRSAANGDGSPAEAANRPDRSDEGTSTPTGPGRPGSADRPESAVAPDSAASRPEPDPAAGTGGVAIGTGTGQGSNCLPQRAGPAPTHVPPSPPTTPMPFVKRGPVVGAQPAARPTGAQEPLQQRSGATPNRPNPDRSGPDRSGPDRSGPDRTNPEQRPEGSAPRPQPVAQDRPPAPADRPAAGPSRQPDELFAPSVPVIAEPGTSAPARQDGDNGRLNGFDLGETTPIFAEIASAWFRSNRPVPVSWETEQPEDARPEPETVRPQPEVRPAPSPAPVRPARPVTPPTPPPAPAPEPAREPSAVSASADRGFTSVADAGWRAASGSETDRSDELTASGLPKRRPRARLVPGSAGSAVLAPPVSAARSAETVRGRLASYQQGVRQGRESRVRGDTGAAAADSGTKPAPAGGNHDEEST